MADEPDDPEISVVQEKYPQQCELAEQRRAFILSHMADAEIDGKILLDNMKSIETWLETGNVPAKDTKKTSLKVVAEPKP